MKLFLICFAYCSINNLMKLIIMMKTTIWICTHVNLTQPHELTIMVKCNAKQGPGLKLNTGN